MVDVGFGWPVLIGQLTPVLLENSLRVAGPTASEVAILHQALFRWGWGWYIAVLFSKCIRQSCPEQD